MNALTKPLNAANEAVSNASNAIIDVANGAANAVANAATGATNAVASLANGTANAVASFGTGTTNALVSLGAPNTAKNVASGTTNAVVNVANGIGNSLFAIGNTAKNVAKNIGNSAQNILPTAITAPINASIQATPEPDTLWVTIPLILAIGALIVAFTLFVVFKDQILYGFETAWNKLRSLFGFGSSDGPTSGPVPEQAYIPDDGTTSNLVEKILPGRKEVFNIAENHYKFSDAEPLCKALGAELATYEQVKDAWNTGADWCNYGWVKGQAAIYPTQQSTFDKLQNEGTEDERLACGQVGINGGYFDNPQLRFGVNCYGVKPSESEHSMANVMKSEGQPMTPEAITFDKKVLNYKAHSNEIAINPYKPGTWSN